MESIRQYEKWVAATPTMEAEWSALTREYGELRRHYDFLVSQDLQARSALNLERKQKGSQFRIEDPAREPYKPVSPDFIKIMAIALVAGAGVGGALALGIELLDTSFRDPTDLENAFGVEVMCSVPYLPLRKEIIRKRLWGIVGGCFFFAFGSVVVAAVVYFWREGQIIL